LGGAGAAFDADYRCLQVWAPVDWCSQSLSQIAGDVRRPQTAAIEAAMHFADILSGLKAEGSGDTVKNHAAFLRLVPASSGRLARCSSAGFNALSARRRMLLVSMDRTPNIFHLTNPYKELFSAHRVDG